MCHTFRTQKGAPLDQETLSRMGLEERTFWEDFLQETKKIVDKNRKENKKEPFTMSPSLKEKFQTAITRYKGEQYCQIQQIRTLFTL